MAQTPGASSSNPNPVTHGDQDDPCVLEGCNIMGGVCLYCGKTRTCVLCGIEDAVTLCSHCHEANVCDACHQYCNSCNETICNCCLEEGREALCNDLRDDNDDDDGHESDHEDIESVEADEEEEEKAPIPPKPADVTTLTENLGGMQLDDMQID
jgi:hypothetical protein